MTVQSGLDQIKTISLDYQNKNIALLCHAASIDSSYNHAISIFKATFGEKLKKIFGPQHGLIGNVQDNMIESDHYDHPYFNLPIYSLYSETRIPTDKMLEGIDVIFVDLQDVGCRIYTYIYTTTLLMKKCAELGIEVVILDRPNPIGGNQIEGNILNLNFKSFVGMHPIPTRHGLTIGEVALMANKFWQDPCDLRILEMNNWKREMYFRDTLLPWVLPSPNLATPEAAITFMSTVYYEGTNISEGRGTTISLENLGHPNIEPYSFLESILPKLSHLEGFVLRPCIFQPTFQKHAGVDCGGFQIHVTDKLKFRPWELGQILMREFYHHLGDKFEWKKPPYEYEYDDHPINFINGTDKIKNWIESNGSIEELHQVEQESLAEYNQARNQVLLY